MKPFGGSYDKYSQSRLIAQSLSKISDVHEKETKDEDDIFGSLLKNEDPLSFLIMDSPSLKSEAMKSDCQFSSFAQEHQYDQQTYSSTFPSNVSKSYQLGLDPNHLLQNPFVSSSPYLSHPPKRDYDPCSLGISLLPTTTSLAATESATKMETLPRQKELFTDPFIGFLPNKLGAQSLDQSRAPAYRLPGSSTRGPASTSPSSLSSGGSIAPPTGPVQVSIIPCKQTENSRPCSTANSNTFGRPLPASIAPPQDPLFQTASSFPSFHSSIFSMPLMYPPKIPLTSDQVQSLLDENRELINTAHEYQNLGRVAESLHYQARLHANMTVLANLADKLTQSQRLTHPLAKRPSNMMMMPTVSTAGNIPSSALPSLLSSAEIDGSCLKQSRKRASIKAKPATQKSSCSFALSPYTESKENLISYRPIDDLSSITHQDHPFYYQTLHPLSSPIHSFNEQQDRLNEVRRDVHDHFIHATGKVASDVGNLIMHSGRLGTNSAPSPFDNGSIFSSSHRPDPKEALDGSDCAEDRSEYDMPSV